MTPPTVSVVLCTFDGERYLRQQLDSLLAQTLQPDEVIVCDDASTDGTVEIVRSYGASFGGRLHLQVNAANRGFRLNFEQGIGLATGELIALCDQDDAWLPTKLATQAAAFMESPGLAGLFTDALLMDADGARLAGTSFGRLGFSVDAFDRLSPEARTDLLLSHFFCTGTTMMFRSRYRPLLLPLPDPGAWPYHDAWFAAALSTVGECRALATPLVDYRLHAGQVVGMPQGDPAALEPRSRRERLAGFTQRVERLAPLVGRLATTTDAPRLESPRPRLERMLRHYGVRAQAQARVTPVAVLRERRRGGYTEFSSGRMSVLADLTRLRRPLP